MTKNHTLNLGKIDYYGRGRKINRVTVEWELSADGRFSMSGNVWNGNGTDIVSGGQNLEEVATLFPHHSKLQRMIAVWREWHLNDMAPGCEHQRADGWGKRPIDPSKPLNAYGKHFPGQHQDSWNILTWVRPDEHPEGLLTAECPVCGYRYGSAWLKREIPQSVLDEINSWSAEMVAA